MTSGEVLRATQAKPARIFPGWCTRNLRRIDVPETPFLEPTRQLLAAPVAGYPLGTLLFNGVLIAGGILVGIAFFRHLFAKAFGK